MTVDAFADRHQFSWLLGNFVTQTDGVREAVAVSSDGLLIASSDGLSRTDADHLAAIVSSLSSLGRSAARRYDFEGLKLVMIEMKRGFLLVSAIEGGSCLGVVADPTATSGSSATRSPRSPNASDRCSPRLSSPSPAKPFPGDPR